MRLFYSLSFRLAVVYVVLFALSLCALIGLNYWLAVYRPLALIEAQVRTEADDLGDSYIIDSPDMFKRRLEARTRQDAERKAYYAFLSPDGREVFTNLPSIPSRSPEGLTRIEADIYVDGDEEDHMALAIDRKFRTGARLVVGRDIEDIAQHEELIRAAVPWTLGVSILLGVMGGVIMSFAIGRRVDAVSSTARTVISGDMSGRVPLRGTGDDFDRLGETFNLMLDRIEESMRAVHRVSDNVAHELRTPLARMQTMLDRAKRLRSNEDEEAIDVLLDGLSDEGQRLQTISDALLRISRIEGGVHELQMVDVDAATMLENVFELYTPAAEDKSIRFELRLNATPRLRGDADLLSQGLCNLIDNAIKYTPEQGEVIVSLNSDDRGKPCIAVADTGPGIDKASRGRLTERFFRGANIVDNEGYGLGLSLVAAVAAAHHSQLDFVDRNPGLCVRWTF